MRAFLGTRAFLSAAAFAASAAFASPARAEEIVLVSGTTYDARDVALLDKDVRFTFSVGGGHATVVVPMDRVDARSLLGLFIARTVSNDGAGQLRIARFALARGLLAEAATRFRRAATIDPALAKDRDEGLASIADAETEIVLKSAEQSVRMGRNDLAAPKAREALSRAAVGSPLALRAAGILDLSLRLADHDRERAKADAEARAAAEEAAEQAAFEGALASADKAATGALARRAKAADPTVSASEALRQLESAETGLRDARRSLATARPLAGARVAEVDKRDGDALVLLVATHLDLADLYRQQRRFDKARDRVRAALVLDPQSVRAQQTQDRIEQDLRTPPPVPYDPFDTPYYAPSFVYSETYGFPYARRVVTPYAPYAPCSPYRGCSPGFSFGWHSSSLGFFFRW